MKSYYKNLKDVKLMDDLSKCKYKCKCGHSVIFPADRKREWTVCGWCGCRIFKDPEKQKQWNAKCEKEDFRVKFNNYLKSIQRKENSVR